MDAGLATELGLDGVHADAVRDLAAVTAAVTHRLVDEHPRLRCLDTRSAACLPGVGPSALAGCVGDSADSIR